MDTSMESPDKKKLKSRHSILKREKDPKSNETHCENKENAQATNRKVRFSTNLVKKFTTENDDGATIWGETFEEDIGSTSQSTQSTNSLQNVTGGKSEINNSEYKTIQCTTSDLHWMHQSSENNAPNETLGISNMSFTQVIQKTSNSIRKSEVDLMQSLWQSPLNKIHNKSYFFNESDDNKQYNEFIANKENIVLAINKTDFTEGQNVELNNMESKTIIFDAESGGMELEKPLNSNKATNVSNISSNKHNTDHLQHTQTFLAGATSRKTILFNDGCNDMEFTRHIPLDDTATLSKEPNLELNNAKSKSQTILYDVGSDDMDLEEPPSSNVNQTTDLYKINKTNLTKGQNVEFHKTESNTKTIIFDADSDGMELEEHIPSANKITTVTDISSNKHNTENCRDSKHTQPVTSAGTSNRKTIFFNDSCNDMEFTQHIPLIDAATLVKEPILELNNTKSNRKSILYEVGSDDMELEEPTPLSNVNKNTDLYKINKINFRKVQNVELHNAELNTKTILFDADSDGMELEEHILPSNANKSTNAANISSNKYNTKNCRDSKHTQPVTAADASNRKTIFFNDSCNDMEFTQHIPLADASKIAKVPNIKLNNAESNRKTIMFDAGSDDMELEEPLSTNANKSTELNKFSGNKYDKENSRDSKHSHSVAINRKTILFNNSCNNMELTLHIPPSVSTVGGTNGQTILFNDSSNDMELTEHISIDMMKNVDNNVALPPYSSLENTVAKVKNNAASRKTILFSDTSNDMELTEHVPTDIIKNVDNNIALPPSSSLTNAKNNATNRKTILFNDSSNDMELTSHIPREMIKNVDNIIALAPLENTVANVKNNATSRKTILFSDTSNDMELTEHIPIDIIKNVDNNIALPSSSSLANAKNNATNRRTIIFNDTSNDMELTEHIPIDIIKNVDNNIALPPSSSLVNAKNNATDRKTILFNDTSNDMELTSHIPREMIKNVDNIIALPPYSSLENTIANAKNNATNRKTILFNDSSNDMELTEHIPTDIIKNVDNNIALPPSSSLANAKNNATNRRTIIFNDSSNEMELTKHIPIDIIKNVDNNIALPPSLSFANAKNNATNRKTILFSDTSNDMELTEHIPIDIMKNVENNIALPPSSSLASAKINATNRKTIIFNDSSNDMELTEHIPIDIIKNVDNNIALPAYSSLENTVANAKSNAANRKTILFNDSSNDMELTKHIAIETIKNVDENIALPPSSSLENIVTNVKNKNIEIINKPDDNIALPLFSSLKNAVRNVKHNAANTKTILFNDDSNDMKLTKHIPTEVIRKMDDNITLLPSSLENLVKNMNASPCTLPDVVIKEKENVVDISYGRTNVSSIKATSDVLIGNTELKNVIDTKKLIEVSNNLSLLVPNSIHLHKSELKDAESNTNKIFTAHSDIMNLEEYAPPLNISKSTDLNDIPHFEDKLSDVSLKDVEFTKVLHIQSNNMESRKKATLFNVNCNDKECAENISTPEENKNTEPNNIALSKHTNLEVPETDTSNMVFEKRFNDLKLTEKNPIENITKMNDKTNVENDESNPFTDMSNMEVIEDLILEERKNISLERFSSFPNDEYSKNPNIALSENIESNDPKEFAEEEEAISAILSDSMEDEERIHSLSCQLRDAEESLYHRTLVNGLNVSVKNFIKIHTSLKKTSLAAEKSLIDMEVEEQIESFELEKVPQKNFPYKIYEDSICKLDESTHQMDCTPPHDDTQNLINCNLGKDASLSNKLQELKPNEMLLKEFIPLSEPATNETDIFNKNNYRNPIAIDPCASPAAKRPCLSAVQVQQKGTNNTTIDEFNCLKEESLKALDESTSISLCSIDLSNAEEGEFIQTCAATSEAVAVFKEDTAVATEKKIRIYSNKEIISALNLTDTPPSNLSHIQSTYIQRCRENNEIDKNNDDIIKWIRTAAKCFRAPKIVPKPPTLREQILDRRRKNVIAIHALTKCEYKILTFYGRIRLHVTIDYNNNGLVAAVESESINTFESNMMNLMRNLCMDKFRKDKIESSVGQKYNVFTLLDYIEMNVGEYMSLSEELKDLRHHGLEVTDDNKIILMHNHIPMCLSFDVEIEIADVNNLTEKSIEVKEYAGRINKQEIKKLIRNCPNGFFFARKYIRSINEYLEDIWASRRDAF